MIAVITRNDVAEKCVPMEIKSMAKFTTDKNKQVCLK